MTETAFDIVSPAFHADPFPTLERMRRTAPVLRMRLPIVGRSWVVTTHSGCADLLKAHETFARDPGNAGSRTQERILRFLPRTIRALALNMLSLDDPGHRRLRRVVDHAFQRRMVEALRPMIVATADALLDRMSGRREADLLADYSRDLPLSVISTMLGLPERDHDWFKGWLGGLKDTANIGAVLRAVPGVIGIVRYLKRMARPGSEARADGLIAVLRDLEIEGERLTEDEIVSMVFLLFGAGQETTTHLISGGLHELLARPAELERLKADPALMPTCVEECLRHVSPVQMTKPRFVVRDVAWQGAQLRRGDMVVGMLAAANSDEAKFERPRAFDIGRHPNPHLALGTGVHFCLGFQLARMEAAIAFERLLERFPRVRLAPDTTGIRWRKRLGLRAIVALPVQLTG
jgi:cytochrome P450